MACCILKMVMSHVAIFPMLMTGRPAQGWGGDGKSIHPMHILSIQLLIPQ